jgi:hypothetical protein
MSDHFWESLFGFLVLAMGQIIMYLRQRADNKYLKKGLKENTDLTISVASEAKDDVKAAAASVVEIHKQINGRMEELIKATGNAAYEKGKADARQ